MWKEKEALEYLERIQKSGSILGLDSIRRLMEALGNIQDKLKIIHVAGTNGKGSVCAMLSSILIEAGYRVGTYTSPAVFDKMEQYQINGAPISKQDFLTLIFDVKNACDQIVAKGENQPTIFEVETAAAFLYFFQKECQIVVLETGMGGATDATNIIRKPLVSILTSISKDHMKFLGNSIEEIARVKAGIIKREGSVVAIEPKQEGVRREIERVCREKNATLIYSKKETAKDIHREQETLCFSYGNLGEIHLSLLGAYQIENSICAIEAAHILQKSGIKLCDANIKQGLEKASWEGRFSIICRNPYFVIDGAHNEDAAKKLCETLKMGFTNRKIIYIIGVLADKEHEKMLEILLPFAWKVFTITPNNIRALDGKILAKEARKYHSDVTYGKHLGQVVEEAITYAREKEAIIVSFGSLSYLGELREILRKKVTDKSEVISSST